MLIALAKGKNVDFSCNFSFIEPTLYLQVQRFSISLYLFHADEVTCVTKPIGRTMWTNQTKLSSLFLSVSPFFLQNWKKPSNYSSSINNVTHMREFLLLNRKNSWFVTYSTWKSIKCPKSQFVLLRLQLQLGQQVLIDLELKNSMYQKPV